MADSWLKTLTAEERLAVLRAVNSIVGCILPWAQWVIQQRQQGDAENHMPSRWRETVAHAVRLILALGVDSPPFAGTSKEEFCERFPPVPDPQIANYDKVLQTVVSSPWQGRYDIQSAEERTWKLFELEGQLNGLKCLLEGTIPPTELTEGQATGTAGTTTPTGTPEKGEGTAEDDATPDTPKEGEGTAEDNATPDTGTPTKATGKQKRGRKVTRETIRRADFANPLRVKGETWPSIYAAFEKKYPRDTDTTEDKLRRAFERQYPKLAAKPKNDKATD